MTATVAASRTLRARLETAERIAAYHPNPATRQGAEQWLHDTTRHAPPYPPAFTRKDKP